MDSAKLSRPASKPNKKATRLTQPAVARKRSATVATSGKSERQGYGDRVLSLVNKSRKQKGLAALTRNKNLDRAAQVHARDMVAKNYFSHQGRDGTTPKDRIQAAGYQGMAFGENIAQGQKTGKEVVQSWLDSPPHRANILNRDYKYMGIARVYKDEIYRYFWVQTFGG